MKAVKQYFPAVLFVLLCSVVLTFESADETLKCDHSNEKTVGRSPLKGVVTFLLQKVVLIL